ncbi:MAG: serine dehydratase beta chain, partial [Pseudomonadota bacterium]
MLSVLDIFKVGIGPSSSHTVGPMRIANRFVAEACGAKVLAAARRVTISLHGSLALTGIGHGTDKATILGLAGHEPDRINPDRADADFDAVCASKTLTLATTDGAQSQTIAFDPVTDLALRG